MHITILPRICTTQFSYFHKSHKNR